MNGYQRAMATFRGEKTDTLALMPITMMLAADLIDVPYGEYVTDYRILVRGQLETARRFQFDHVSVISDPAREAADHGADVRFYEDAPPAIDESNALLADKSKLAALPTLDPLKPNSRSLDRIEGVRSLAEVVKNELLIEGWVEGPCAEAADLRGINNLMLDFHDDPAGANRRGHRLDGLGKNDAGQPARALLRRVERRGGNRRASDRGVPERTVAP